MICCRDLYAGYGPRTVLHGLNICANAGETVALLGPNGSGKTTLLSTLSGVLTPRRGNIFLGDPTSPHTNEAPVPLNRLSPRERARRVAVVPQRVEHLPHIRVRDMVLLGRYAYLSWWGSYGPEDHHAADEALDLTGTHSLSRRYIEELSGGELQRVLLARALAQQTPVLLLDELSAGLDVARMKELFDLLELRRRAGSCVVTVMHDLNLAALYATRLVGLQAGRVLFDGHVTEVFTEEYLSTLYETPIHVFPHPVCPVPQACPGACGTFAAADHYSCSGGHHRY